MKKYKIQITDQAFYDMDDNYNCISEQLQIPNATME